MKDHQIARHLSKAPPQCARAGRGAQGLAGLAEGVGPAGRGGKRAVGAQQGPARSSVDEHQPPDVAGHRCQLRRRDVSRQGPFQGDPVPDVALFVPFQTRRAQQAGTQEQRQFASAEPRAAVADQVHDGAAVGTKQFVGQVHSNPAAERRRLCLVYSCPPPGDLAVGDEVVEGRREAGFHGVPGRSWLEPKPPAGVFAHEPPCGDGAAVFGMV